MRATTNTYDSPSSLGNRGKTSVSDSKCAMCKRLGASSFNLVVYSKETHGMVKVCPFCYHSIQETTNVLKTLDSSKSGRLQRGEFSDNDETNVL